MSPQITVREFRSGVPLVTIGALLTPPAHHSLLKDEATQRCPGPSAETLLHTPTMSDGFKPPSTRKIGRRKDKPGHQHHGRYGGCKQSLAVISL